ncbi:MAG: hypothetical protein ACO1NO_10165 [Burkholderiaceae bacterium]
MNDTLDGIASTVPGLKPVRWNVDKIHAALCICASICVSAGLIAWGVYVF